MERLLLLLAGLALLGSPASRAQSYGDMLAFDGLLGEAERDLVDFGDRAAFDFGTADFTIEFWLNKPDGRLEEVLNKRVTCAALLPTWAINADVTIGLGFIDDGIVLVTTIPAPVVDGSWHHVAFTREDGTVRGYLDGVLEIENVQPNSFDLANDAPMRLAVSACVEAGLVAPFSGTMDELMIWNEARTGTEIQQDLLGTRTGGEPGLIGYWKMDEGSGQVLGDASPNNRDGQLGSTPGSDGNDPTWFASTVPVASEGEPGSLGLALTARPNPASRQTVVSFALSHLGPVRLRLLDALGREVAVLVEGAYPVGVHAVAFDAGALPAGVYLVRLEAAGQVLTQPITRVH
jgi:hypothetical protein